MKKYMVKFQTIFDIEDFIKIQEELPFCGYLSNGAEIIEINDVLNIADVCSLSPVQLTVTSSSDFAGLEKSFIDAGLLVKAYGT
ncbi:MAG: hypothetical protein QM697_00200 [Lachnospiraceae bacterium]